MAYRNMHHPTGLTGPELDDYLARGWYRMQQSIFTITHSFREELFDFRPVWWLRFPVRGLPRHLSHDRIRRRNRHLRLRLAQPFRPDAASEALYARYLASVPFEGYPSIADALYGDAGPDADTIYDTRAIILSDGPRDVAMGIYDLGHRAGASILHFYDPDFARHSLGKYLMLLTLDQLGTAGCEWYYPGYVVSGIPRFDYKLFLGRDRAAYFEPAEQAWRPFRDELLRYAPSDPQDLGMGTADFLF